jgi:hypothetical protein
MKKPLLLLIGLVSFTLSFAQALISGTVIDAETKLPLENASVFAQNTTRGTITGKEGVFRLQLERGGYELIVSFTGYVSKTINIEASEDRQLTIELQKADNSMSEVVIKSSNEVADGWEKHGQFFLENFIGATPFADSCTLLNPEVLKFFYYKRNDRLKVLATEPLVIANRALGYQIRYQLDSFVYFLKTDINAYRGYCFFTVMEGSEEEQKMWEENRKKAYYGSRLHFLRSYFDSTLKGEGFSVDLLSSTQANKFDRLRNPYDTTYYFFDEESGNAELWFPVKASITYTKALPEKSYLEQSGLPLDVPVQLSYIDLAQPIFIRPNGFFLDQKSWTNQGYWSWKNLADQLPYDYEPSKR